MEVALIFSGVTWNKLSSLTLCSAGTHSFLALEMSLSETHMERKLSGKGNFKIIYVMSDKSKR